MKHDWQACIVLSRIHQGQRGFPMKKLTPDNVFAVERGGS